MRDWVPSPRGTGGYPVPTTREARRRRYSLSRQKEGLSGEFRLLDELAARKRRRGRKMSPQAIDRMVRETRLVRALCVGACLRQAATSRIHPVTEPAFCPRRTQLGHGYGAAAGF